MKDDSREKRRRELLPRIALLACLALVVASLGVALSPRSPEKPAEPPFSEQARSAALAETMRLRAAGEQLGKSGSAPAVARTVSLLTSQARALLVPGQNAAGTTAPAAPPTPSSATPSGSAPASAAESSASAPASAAASPPVSAAALASELATSGSQRLADAAVADGGIARLLAAVGTAQLVQASALAVAAGVPAPDVSDPAAPPLSGACPSASAPPSSSVEDALPSGSASAGQDPAPASLPAALAATVETELETVYGYQVALTRLGGEASGPASELLARHEALATSAGTLSRMHCAPVPSPEAGYRMAPEFLASPTAGLGRLEVSALPVYGDLVAMSEGETRQWAISGLVGAARRAALWGADPGVLPGLTADPDGFPGLP